MESDVAGQRYTTWFLWREGVSAAEIHRRLTAVCGPNSPSRATVYNWIDAFKAGKTSTEDAPRSGRPVTASTLEKVNQIRDLVKSDPRVTISELSDQTGISFGSVQTILSEELGLSKLTCRWIPKLLTQEQLFTRVEVSRLLLERQTREGPGFLDRIVAGDEAWFFFHEPETKTMSKEWRPVGSPPPLKPRETISAAKRMAIVFWDNIGILLIDWVPHGATINSQYYITVLENLRESIKQNRRGKLTRGVLLLHDNARPHTSHETSAAIQRLGFEVLQHPPYSPDLSPCDYYLFAEMKRPLKGKKYESPQALASAVHQWVKSTPTEWFRAGIAKLPDRWARCIERHGEFVETADPEDFL